MKTQEEVYGRPEDWKPIIKSIIFQVFYRQLGIVAISCGLSVSSQAIDMLSKEGYGNWKWLVENRILLWENIPIDKAAKVHSYVLGGKSRQKNTVFIRQGFWRMWVTEGLLATFDKSIIGRILAVL